MLENFGTRHFREVNFFAHSDDHLKLTNERFKLDEHGPRLGPFTQPAGHNVACAMLSRSLNAVGAVSQPLLDLLLHTNLTTGTESVEELYELGLDLS